MIPADELLCLIVEQAPEMIFLQDRAQRYVWVAHPIPPWGDEASIIGRDDAALLGPTGEAIAARKQRLLDEGGAHDQWSTLRAEAVVS